MIAAVAATTITPVIESFPFDAYTAAAISAVSPGSHRPADSRQTIPNRKKSP